MFPAKKTRSHLQARVQKLRNETRPLCVGCLILAFILFPTPAQAEWAFSVSHQFGETTSTQPVDGRYPIGGLLHGSDGFLYGVTTHGGAWDAGVVFKAGSLSNHYEVLIEFTGVLGDGRLPIGNVIEGVDGWLYGTTVYGGEFGSGTIFRLRKDGSGYTIIKSLGANDEDAKSPHAALLEGSDGFLYGTTFDGGSFGAGTIFRMEPSGDNYSIIKSFGAGPADGSVPIASLIEAPNGSLYGTTPWGGKFGSGTIFKVKKDGADFTILWSFGDSNVDGQTPKSSLLLSNDGELYGTTAEGGLTFQGTIFKMDTEGTNYSIIHHFDFEHGSRPLAALVEDGSGTLFSTTLAGGVSLYGTVYALRKDGSHFENLKGFDIGLDGGQPFGSVVISTNGTIFGVAANGGEHSFGTIFRMTRQPRILAVRPDSDGVHVRFSGIEGTHYVLEHSVDLSTWNPLNDTVAPPGGIIEYLHESMTTQSGFYRVKAP